jgi:hypothetical protein
MNKFSKAVIASVLAVIVASPALASPKVVGSYVGEKLQVKINPQGCKNFKSEKLPANLEFVNLNATAKQSGLWKLSGLNVISGIEVINGVYTERKVDKELTVAIDTGDVGFCVDDDIGTECIGMAETIQTWLVTQGCGFMTPIQSGLLTVTKGQVKFSKDVTKAKVDLKVEGNYLNDGKAKKVKFTIKSNNMQYVPYVD